MSKFEFWVEIDVLAELVGNLFNALGDVFTVDKNQHIDRHIAVSSIEIDAEALVTLSPNLLIERLDVAVLALSLSKGC